MITYRAFFNNQNELHSIRVSKQFPNNKNKTRRDKTNNMAMIAMANNSMEIKHTTFKQAKSPASPLQIQMKQIK